MSAYGIHNEWGKAYDSVSILLDQLEKERKILEKMKERKYNITRVAEYEMQKQRYDILQRRAARSIIFLKNSIKQAGDAPSPKKKARKYRPQRIRKSSPRKYRPQRIVKSSPRKYRPQRIGKALKRNF